MSAKVIANTTAFPCIYEEEYDWTWRGIVLRLFSARKGAFVLHPGEHIIWEETPGMKLMCYVDHSLPPDDIHTIH